MPCFHASYGRRSKRSVKASSLVVQGRCSGDCSITFRPWNQPTRRSLEKHPSRRKFPWFDWVMSWHFHGPDPKSLECTINLQHPSLSSPNHPISRCICWSAPQVFHHLDTMTSLENNMKKRHVWHQELDAFKPAWVMIFNSTANDKADCTCQGEKWISCNLISFFSLQSVKHKKGREIHRQRTRRDSGKDNEWHRVIMMFTYVLQCFAMFTSGKKLRRYQIFTSNCKPPVSRRDVVQSCPRSSTRRTTSLRETNRSMPGSSKMVRVDG